MTSMQSVSVGEMVAQSRDVITNPSVTTFERYERRGSLGNALVYVGIAAAIAGVFGLVNGIGGLLSGVILGILGFFVFTGLVYYGGKQFFNGTGNWDEVAYTFSLFWAPLMVIGGVQLIMIGIMGEYIGKILSELKARPVYFVAEHTLKAAEGEGVAGSPPTRSAAE